MARPATSYREAGPWFAAMRSRLRRLDDRTDRLAQSRNTLADHIDAAERRGDESHPPFDDACLASAPA